MINGMGRALIYLTMIGALLSAADVTVAAPLLGAADNKTYKAAFKAADKLDWTRAFALAAKTSEPLPAKVIEWLFIQEPRGGASFDRISAFIDANPDWPHMRQLLDLAEVALADNGPAAVALDWFARHPPVNGEGHFKLAQALVASGDSAAAADHMRQAWREGNFTAARERVFLGRFGTLLTPEDHIARLDRMLWNGSWGASRRAVRRVGPDWAALGRARIALMVRAWNVDQAIARVPDYLRGHPGLVYERIRWRRRKGKHDSAAELLATAGRQTSALARPDKWWYERRRQARRVLGEGRVTEAYELASRHGMANAADWNSQGRTFDNAPTAVRGRIAEAEWLSGWIALEFLYQPDIAGEHFLHAYQVVRYPISVARHAYWAGRAATARGDGEGARQWFRTAAAHPATFYGQLAADALGSAVVHDTPSTPPPGADALAAYRGRELVRVIGMLSELGQRRRLRPFVPSLIDAAKSVAERALLAEYLKRLGRIELAVMVARNSARDGLMLPDYNYPRPRLAISITGDAALVHAIMRRESAFEQKARSPAGALGLMQLMPLTARQTAAKLNLAYSKGRLTSDPGYNLRLGTAYLDQLLTKYGGSYVLALAAYNAGPNAVARWLRSNGDPRDFETDAVRWIERIPYSETRNYVRGVLGTTQVYRHLIAGGALQLPDLGSDLNRAARPARPVLLPRPRPGAEGRKAAGIVPGE